jgi:hypothetical protein
MEFEYRISFADGSVWFLTTDESPLDVCERAGLLPYVIDVETLDLVGA